MDNEFKKDIIIALEIQADMNEIEQSSIATLIKVGIKQEENLKVLNETVLMLIEEIERLRSIVEK